MVYKIWTVYIVKKSTKKGQEENLLYRAVVHKEQITIHFFLKKNL